jgi:bifunctional UDP-N-acetylglucosamine pyrophosphorylase/glucosamine-1-phosphate N-acetyltransferase
MLNVVILAAGQGKRMYSDLPKVLHPLAGRPLLAHVIKAAQALSPDAIYVVYGHRGEAVRQAFTTDTNIKWVEQTEQRGTAHAVEQVLPFLTDDSTTLVLYGDVPLVAISTLRKLCDALPMDSVSLLVADVANPAGLGRIIRDKNNQVQAIVEDKDCNAQQRQITEIYSGIMAIHTGQLRKWLALVDNNNSQKEFYLTSIPALAIADGLAVSSVAAESELEVLGVNTKTQLALLERCFQQQQAEELMAQGVTLYDPARFDLRGNAAVGRDISIDINVILEGDITLGDRVKIGANSILRNVRVADDVVIKENCVIEDTVIEPGCTVGPFARIRPGTHLAEGALVGNFVEIKKSTIGSGSKVSHLSYIGDADVGKKVNVGAGTITCNYDGVNKHTTKIGDNAFIGSNTSLVAPIIIGENATIGAGSTVTKEVPANNLTVARTKQTTIAGWQRPQKNGG